MFSKNPYSQRVAIFTPIGKDASLTAAILENSAVESIICPTIASLEAVIHEGVGCVLIAEEAIDGDRNGTLARKLSQQPKWSDLPLLLLTRYGADSPTVDYVLQSFSNVT